MAFDLIASPARGQWHTPRPTAMARRAPRVGTPEYETALVQSVVTGDWLIQAPDIGMRQSFTYDDGVHYWEHRIIDISDIEITVPPGGGIATVANVSIRLSESNDNILQGGILFKWQEAFAVDGVAITIDFLLDGAETTLRVFTGRIDTITLEGAISTILCVDDSIHRNLLLPQTLVTSATYPNASERALTQPIPLVYGTGARAGAMPTMLVHVSANTYLVADHAMAAIGMFGVFVPDVGVFLTASLASAIINSAESTVILPTPLQENRFGVVAPSLVVQEQVSVSNAAHAIDGISTTAAIVSMTTVASTLDGQGILGIATVPEAGQRGANTVLVDLTRHRRIIGSDPTVTGTFIIQTIIPATGSAVRADLFRTEAFRHTLNPTTTALTIPSLNLGRGEAVEVRLIANNEGGVGGAAQGYEIGEVGIQFAYQPSGDELPLYLIDDWQGRFDGNGTIVSYASLGTGTVYTQPDHIIASLMQEELGLTIDRATFAAAYNYYAVTQYVLDGGMGAGWSQSRQNARQVLDTLARQSRALLHPTFNGAWGLRPYRGRESPLFHFDTSRILQTLGAEERVGQPPQSTFIATLGNLETVYNRFEVHYHYNVGTRQYDRVFTVDETGTNVPAGGDLVGLCMASVLRHGRLEPFVLEADWVADDASAALLIRHYVEYFSATRIVVQFETTMVAAARQVGDHIIVTYPTLSSGDNGGYFEIHTLRYKPLQGRIAITASKPAVLQHLVRVGSAPTATSLPRAAWRAVAAIHPDARAAVISPARTKWQAPAVLLTRGLVVTPARGQWKAGTASVISA